MWKVTGARNRTFLCTGSSIHKSPDRGDGDDAGVGVGAPSGARHKLDRVRAAVGRAAGTAPDGCMRVLLAEDSGVTRRLFAQVIAECGHDVTEVDNGHSAWQVFRNSPAPLVVLDWLMPVMDGLEVCRRIRASEASAETYVLMATGRGDPSDVASALDAGADDFITKPVAPEHLRAQLTIAERRIEQGNARRRAEEGLARAQWLAGIGHTALTLQHEINNPLTVVLAEAELLAIDTGIPEPYRRRLAMVAVQARRIAAVVKQISSMEDPRTVEYVAGVHMIDLSAARG
jgi:DNA-binding response OmpR family regulator